MQVDITVLGGLPITVQFEIESADPEVGIMSAGVGDWDITHINGKPCKKSPEWLYRRIDAVKGEHNRLFEQLGEAVSAACEYDYHED